MSQRLFETTAFAAFILLIRTTVMAYEDDDLLCRPGWSPELYHQQIWQQNNQGRIGMMEYQTAMANAAAEQRSQEMARIARRASQEKAARKREELIAKRKAENAAKAMATTVQNQAAKTALKPNP